MTVQEKYLSYADKVLSTLETALDNPAIDESDIVALMIEFGEYKDLESLKNRVSELSDLYPFLSIVKELEVEESVESFEEVVQQYISFLIQNGRANEVTKLNTYLQNSNKSITDLKQEFPEINQLTI